MDPNTASISTVDSTQNQNGNMDDYICPLCETECTCSRPKLPVLKIKLTVPPSMAKQPAPAPPPPPVKRKRGRPPKALSGTAVTQPQPKKKSGRPPGRPRKHPLPVLDPATVTVPKKIQRPSSDNASSSDDDSFPTFLSASAMPASDSSPSTDSDSVDDMDDVDSEIEKEEERFIRKEQRERGKRDKQVERARVRRQQQQQKTSRRESGRQYQQHQARRESGHARHDILYSDDEPSRPHSEWIVRTRRPSDAGLKMSMDVGSSSSSTADSSDSSDDEDDGGDADEEPEEAAAEAAEDEEDEGPRYTGLATGWSDSEESSFDADLFFANLSDSQSSHDGSDADETISEHGHAPEQSNLHPDTVELGGHMEFEVVEAWDGQLVFSNSHHLPSIGMLDFDVDLYQQSPPDAFIEPLSPPPSQSLSVADDDVEMRTDEDADSTASEEEYEGNTTDEDLVGPDQLPNAKALKIFRLPPRPFDLASLDGVNPLSTLTPVSSPVPKTEAKHLIPPSPAPSDILAGHVRPFDVWGLGDDEDVSMEPPSTPDAKRGRKRARTEGDGPIRGPFSLSLEGRTDGDGEVFVLSGDREVAPSPYRKKASRPRRLLSRIHKHKSGISHDGISSLFPKTLHSTPPRPSSMPPCTREHPSDQDIASSTSSLPDDHASSASDVPGGDSPPTQMIEQIALDDVLDSSFMDDDDTWSDHSTATSGGIGSSLSHIKNLSRWDVISVGAFRKTREGFLSDGWGSDTAGPSKDYGSVMKSSPFNATLWNHRNGRATISPLLSPFLDDGEKTPTGYTASSPNSQSPLHGRKESRRDRKLRRKHASAVHQHHSPSKGRGGAVHPYHQHHVRHQHHPNSKTRSSSSSQRTTFASSPVPPLSL